MQKVLFINIDLSIYEEIKKFYPNVNVSIENNEEEVISKLGRATYDVIFTRVNVQEISAGFYIKTLKRISKCSSVNIIESTISSKLEISLYKSGVTSVIYNHSRELVIFKIKRIIEAMLEKESSFLKDLSNDIVIDTSSVKVYKNGINIVLTKKEYQLLKFFLQNQNRVVTRDVIEKNVWGNTIDGIESRNVDVYVLRIRKKLALENIISIRGIGYEYATKQGN